MKVSDNWGKIPSTWQVSNKLGQLLVINQKALPELFSCFIDDQSRKQGGRQEDQIQWWELKPQPTSLATEGLPPLPVPGSHRDLLSPSCSHSGSPGWALSLTTDLGPMLGENGTGGSAAAQTQGGSDLKSREAYLWS